MGGMYAANVHLENVRISGFGTAVFVPADAHSTARGVRLAGNATGIESHGWVDGPDTIIE